MLADNVKFPQVHVQLSGEDGNAFGIMARVRRAMNEAGLKEEGKAYFEQAVKSGSYDELIQFTMQTVDVS